MAQNSTNLIAKKTGDILKRFHLLLFFIIVATCLAFAVVLVNEILTGNNTDDGYVSPIQAGSIDQQTLTRIQSLHTSDSAPEPVQLEGRINPFSE